MAPETIKALEEIGQAGVNDGQGGANVRVGADVGANGVGARRRRNSLLPLGTRLREDGRFSPSLQTG